MPSVIVRKPRHRRRLSADHTAALVGALGESARCPLSDDEIVDWANQLHHPGAERRLKELLIYWFHQAESFWSAIAAHPPNLRVDQGLSSIAARLDEILSELHEMPNAVDIAIRSRFGAYDTILMTLGVDLKEIALQWDRPNRGQPSATAESQAVALLINAVEEFTGEKFPSPASLKRLTEIEFVRLLVSRLFPSSTSAQIETMLRHYHKRRLEETKTRRP